MKNRILFIYPPIDYNYYIVGVNDSPPIGLVVLQNYIHRKLGNSVRIDIVDGEHSSVEEIINLIRTEKYDFIGLQPMMASYGNSLRILKAAKISGAETSFGGHHATQLAIEIMANRKDILDNIVVGDGEEAILALVEEKPYTEIPNLVFYDKSTGEIKCSPTQNVPIDDGKITWFDRNQLDVYRKNRAQYERKGSMSFRLYSHKGCSNRMNSQYCYFCGRADKGLRFKSPEIYIDELEMLFYEYEADYVFEIGDDFLQDEQWLKETVRLYKNRFQKNEPKHLKIFARANRISPENVYLLRHLNVDEVAIGFESGCQRVLKAINKRITPTQNLEAAKLLFSNGIDTIASFVLGLPEEDAESRKLTYEHALKINELALRYIGQPPQEVIANLVEISPGSPAFIKLKRHFPDKYSNKDFLSVSETQNDLFRLQFGFDSAEQIKMFRCELAFWGQQINQLGRYTYPAGWLKEDIINQKIPRIAQQQCRPKGVVEKEDIREFDH